MEDLNLFLEKKGQTDQPTITNIRDMRVHGQIILHEIYSEKEIEEMF